MKKYTHTFCIAFSVDSDMNDEYECLSEEKDAVLAALQQRIRNVFTDREYVEAIECFDSETN